MHLWFRCTPSMSGDLGRMIVADAWDDAARESLVAGLLAAHPDARLIALNEDGLPVPVPSEVPRPARGVIGRGGGRSYLQLVVSSDQPLVVQAWNDAMDAGAGTVEMRLRDDPVRPVDLHLVDWRFRAGVFVGILTGCAPRGARTVAEEASPTPRVGLIRKDRRGLIIEVDDASCRLLRFTRDDLLGRRSLELVHSDDQERAIASWMDMLSTEGTHRRTQVRHRTGDGGWLWVELTNHNLLADADGGYVLGELVNISEQVEATEALQEKDQLLRRITEALPVGVLHLEADRRIVYRNHCLVQLLGSSDARTLGEQFGQAGDADRDRLCVVVDQVLSDGRDREVELRLHAPAGSIYCQVSVRGLTSRAGDVGGAIVCVSDITESVRLREQLQQRATFDALTGCLNRESILTGVEAELRDAVDDQGTALIFIDIDHFKDVNDAYGHAAGDLILRELGMVLRSEARGDDAVGRIGGDEFLVVCPGVASAAQARIMARRFEAAICRIQVESAGRSLTARATLGVAWSAGGEDADDLIARADGQMYAEKRRRRTGSASLA
jgi:diguanylate cyclase (GGDEF)-like protein/PAS domain S-box-containing protein